MAFNGIFLDAIIVYICAMLSLSYIYRYKKKVKKSVQNIWYMQNIYYLCTQKGLHSVILIKNL